MKIIEWLAANAAILAIGLFAGGCGLAVILLFRAAGLPPDYWPYAGIQAGAATLAGGYFGARGVFWLIDRIGNWRYYRERCGK